MSRQSLSVSACIASLVALTACSPEPHAPRSGIGEADAAVAAESDAGLDTAPRGYAVISGDYAVTSVSLLKADGTLLERDFIDSGSASAGLVTALSGDVGMPTRSGERGVLVLLDRFRADVITRLDLASGEILGQLKTHSPDSKSTQSYSSNPQDYVFIDENTAWISRYEPNLDAKSGDPDLGLDLLRIDPTSFTRKNERVDFSRWNGKAERENPDTGEKESVTVYARPGDIVRLGDYLVVGIESLSASFDAVGEGMVALVDLQTKAVKMLKLPGLQSCGDLAPVPDDDERVAVGCTGFFRGVARDSAGIAMLVLDGDELRIEHVWRANDDAKSALTMYGVSPLSATQVLATAAGEAETDDTQETLDALYSVDLVSGEQRLVLKAKGSYVIGGAAFDPRSGLLLVPDASTDDQGRPIGGVHRFELRADGSFEKLGITKLDDVLPARSVRAFN